MKYFYDTEFLEGKQDKRFLGIKYGETKPTIDLISIGIVSEDGREYYAVSKDFNLKEAWNRWDGGFHEQSGFEKYHGFSPRKKYWIRENVLKPIFDQMCMWDRDNDKHGYFTYKNFRYLLNKYGKSNKEIADDIKKIGLPENEKHIGTYPDTYPENIEFYGYYSDYDHVVLCWLFGKMIDLPKGFPMFTIDLKQTLNEICSYNDYGYDNRMIDIWSSYSFNERLKYLKELPNYPKQTNEHHALSDAIWNKKLYHFLNSL